MKERKMDDEKKNIQKRINDLGCGAYLMMHGFKPIGKEGRVVIFEVESDAEKEFETAKFEYLSTQFHTFDACLMSLKKMSDCSY